MFKKYREAKGLTQEKLAEKAEISTSNIFSIKFRW